MAVDSKYFIANGLEDIDKMMTELINESEIRRDIIKEYSKKGHSIYSYNQEPGNKLKYIYLMIDEYCDLLDNCNKNNKLAADIITKVNHLLKTGRTIGINVILSAQPWSQLLLNSYICNCSNKILFRVYDKVTARRLSNETEISDIHDRGKFIIYNWDGTVYKVGSENFAR